MKYSILGFNQEKLLQYNLNLNEILLLSYIYDAQASPTMNHILEDGKTYTWLNHSKIQSDLPILDADERQLKRYIKHLNDCELINSKQITVNGIRGSRAYYGITELCENLRYDYIGTEQGSKMSPNTPLLGVKNVPSDNLLNLDNKLDNTIPYGIVTEVPTEDESVSKNDNAIGTLSEYESKMYSEDIKRERKVNNKALAETNSPKKKLSLWDKCVQIIEDYTDDENLRNVLKEFLKMRLSMKDKQMYAPQWRCMLDKIATLKGDPVSIVQQSIEHGWASFYDMKSTTSYSKPNISNFGENKCNQSVKVTEDARREMFNRGNVF